MPVKRLVLFDIDETMISSDGAGRRSLARALYQTHRLDESAAAIPMSGKTDPQIIKEILTASGYSALEAEARLHEILALYLQFLDEEIAKSTYYIKHPGVDSLLETLEEHDQAYLGLLTGNVESGAAKKLNYFKLMEYFPIGAYGSDSACRLDLPAIAVERARKHFALDFAPKEVVIIGDSVNDIACAKHFGACVVAVNTGKTSYEELERHKPDFLFRNLENTNQVLEAIFA
ncbi:MAG: HAD hydrolase-like protein [Candidatus Obscuribacterales bacterium]|nr:HAD hydrolase-like protein [Candidatus Obscuribacterales bacterium]